jgi:uncharacterized RDD family membrane protein YckC
MLIDGLLLSIVIFPAVMILGGAFGLAAAPMGDIEGSPVAAAMGGTLFLLFMIIGIGLPWLYEALMVSSSKQATLGKLLLGIVVTDLAGNRVSFARASGRYFGKILSQMVLYIGFLMAAFTEKKQALHDMIAGCLVLVRQ